MTERMRIIQVCEGGVLEFNYMWMPTWLGLNAAFKKQMEKDLSSKFVGRTTEDIDAINREALDYIVEKHPIPGLREYLDGLKFVGHAKT